MTDIRKLPIGIQNFEKLRTEKYVYIDKTQYVYKLAQTSVPYFIGRPRRFGKSLFLSTLRAYFEGKKHLFEGLAVAELEKEWTEFPVIYIDFNQAAYTSLQTLKNVLNDVLKEYEEQLKIKTEEPEYSLRFKKIIKTAFEQTSRKVVVLVDEYDKPLLGTMDDLKVHEDIRVALRGFYGVLKSMDEYLRFVCLTGVTKFSKVSIFSDLNHLLDISMDEKYAGVCGITEKELLDNFQPELESFAERRKMTKEQVLAEMKKNYDGYLFAPESEGVYNPFSLLNAFHSRIFDSYWFETGTPDMLARRVESENLNPRDFDRDTIISTKELKDYRPGETSIIPLLYQSGYLTIKDYEADYGVYRLGFPNEEVKYGFMRNLLPVYAPAQISTLTSFFAGNFVRSLRNGDTEGFMVQLKAFYASIPYNVVRKKQKNEQHYQFIFYLLFTLMGQFVDSEVKSAEGRADAVVKTSTAIYVFEFKLNGTAEAALAQIDDKGYSIPYTADHRQLVKIGVEFDMKKGGIKRWIFKEL